MDWVVFLLLGAVVALVVCAAIGFWLRRRKPVHDPAKRRQRPEHAIAETRLRRLDPLSWVVREHGVLLLVFAYMAIPPLYQISPAPFPAGLLWSIELAIPLSAAGGILCIRRHRKHLFDRLEREGFLVCPDCHYSLAGHAGGGRCPECGYAFTPESVVADWSAVRALAWGKHEKRWSNEKRAEKRGKLDILFPTSGEGCLLLFLAGLTLFTLASIMLPVWFPTEYVLLFVAVLVGAWMFRAWKRS